MDVTVYKEGPKIHQLRLKMDETSVLRMRLKQEDCNWISNEVENEEIDLYDNEKTYETKVANCGTFILVLHNLEKSMIKMVDIMMKGMQDREESLGAKFEPFIG